MPGTEKELVVLVGTDVGALLLVGLDGSVRSVVALSCSSAGSTSTSTAAVVSLTVCNGHRALAVNPNCLVAPAAAFSVLATCANGVALVIPGQSLVGLPRMSSAQQRPLLTDQLPRSGEGARLTPVPTHGLATWLTGSELLQLRRPAAATPDTAGAGGVAKLGFTSAAMYVSRTTPSILGVQGSSVATERHIVATGPAFTFAVHRLTTQTGGKTTAELVAAVAGKITNVATGLFRGFWSGSSATQSAAPAAAVSSPAFDAVELKGSALRGVTVDPQHRFAAGVDNQRNRVLLFDLESCAVVRVFKGCRAAQVGWVRTANSGTSVLAVYLGFRGALELYSPHSADRLGALSVPAQGICAVSSTLIHVVAPGQRLLALRLSVSSTTGQPLGFASSTGIPGNAAGPMSVPPGFRGSHKELVDLVRAAATNCRRCQHVDRNTGGSFVALAQSVPLNLPPEHIVNALTVIIDDIEAVTADDDATTDGDAVTLTEEQLKNSLEPGTKISLPQARHFIASLRSVLQALADLSVLPGARALETNMEASSVVNAKMLCTTALSTVDDQLSPRASALLLRTLRASPVVRSYSRVTADQFVRCFDLTGYKPLIRPSLSSAQRIQIADLLFATPNGHPLGSTAEHRLALGITDAESYRLFLAWLVEKYSVLGWLTSEHFQIALHTIKVCDAGTVESACLSASVHESMIPWLCAIKSHLLHNTVPDAAAYAPLLKLIEQAAVVHEVSQNPSVPPTTFDLQFARDHSLIVALAMPFVSRLSPAADESWLAPIVDLAEHVAQVMGASKEELLFGVCCSMGRHYGSNSHNNAASAEFGSAATQRIDSLSRLVELTRPYLRRGPWLTFAKAAFEPTVQVLWSRLTAAATGDSNPPAISLTDIVGATPRREFVRTIRSLSHACELVLKHEISTNDNDARKTDDGASTSTPVPNETSFDALLEEDRAFWKAAAATETTWFTRVHHITSILSVLLHETFPDGDDTRFPWSAVSLSAADGASGSQPAAINEDQIKAWLTSQAAEPRAPFSALVDVAAIVGCIRNDFVPLLRLEQHLLAGDDDAVLAEDLPSICDRDAAGELILTELGHRLAEKLRKVGKHQDRTVQTHTLVAGLPQPARQWIAQAAAGASKSPRTIELEESSMELAYAVTECEGLLEQYPWIESVPEFVAQIASL